MRRREPIEPAEADEVIDLRERLAPYEEVAQRPDWRADLIAADARRASRSLRHPTPPRS
ncbi:MAG: hypothetical protein ABL966_15015 [Acidimicrobiales bacterium]